MRTRTAIVQPERSVAPFSLAIATTRGYDRAMLDEQHIVREILAALRSEVRAVLLYGSYARGDHFDDSDKDVAVLLADGQAVTRRHYRALDALHRADDALAVAVVSTTDLSPSGFLLELARDHRVLWEAVDGDTRSLLGSLEARAVAQGAQRRRTSTGEPYWVGV